MNESKRFETVWGDKTLSIEVGKYANQAGGSCIVQYGETVLLVTATMSSRETHLPFFPLMVDFEEKHYAAGRIKGSRFMKRAGRPTDEAVLTSRFIDRAIRPLFPEGMKNEVQVIITNLSFDGVNPPDVLGLIGASCALHISDIPWNGPIGCVRIGEQNNEMVLNPTYEQQETSTLDLAFAGTTEKVIMVEAGGKEVLEDVVLKGFWFGLEQMAAPLKLIEEVRAAVGKEKRDVISPKTDEQKQIKEDRLKIEELAKPFILAQVKELFFTTPQATKSERTSQKSELKERTKAFLVEKEIDDDMISYGTNIVSDVIEEEVHRAIVEDGKRIDGREITEIRELVSEVAQLPRVHGSGHFMRGETQVLTVVTLGSPGDQQLLDGMEIVGTKRYFHHYNFPPYSVGEVKPMRGPSRRDIGHGGLAEKALKGMLPSKEDFPYTVQAVSEVFGSNGSSSMASTCGSTLALMDAGVPLKSPVAGIAMGLGNFGGKWKVITDLQDLEDGKGGMDFKIAGSKTGLTAIQMDTKTDGLSKEIIEQTFNQAKEARIQILESMAKAISEPRKELSEYAPRIISVQINPERIGDVIGPGGKMINEIIETTGVQTIDIEDDGLVLITSIGGDAAEKAKQMIERLTKEIAVGEVYKGKVVRLMDFGAIVEFLPKKDGMVHISEMAPWRIEKVTDIVKLGQEVMIKIKEVSDGRTSLSMKDAPGNTYPERKEPTKDSKPTTSNKRPNEKRRPLVVKKKDD